MTHDLPARIRWQWLPGELLALSLLLPAGVFATRGAWEDILSHAVGDANQSHLRLVPVVAGCLAWVRRGRLRHCPRDGRWIGPSIVAVGWCLHSAGDLLHVLAAWHLGAVLVVVGCFLSFAGISYLKRLLPAFAVLLLLVPVPGVLRGQISAPVHRVTADATSALLGMMGVHSVHAGDALSINGRTILLTEACDVLGTVFALLLVSYTFAFTLPIRNPVRFAIVLLSPVIAVLCNVARLTPTVLVYGYVSEDVGRQLDVVGGWVMLPIAFLMLLGLFRVLRWGMIPVYRYTLAYGR